MLKHIFTLFLNQKKTYGGMFVEQCIVFMVLLFCFLMIGEKASLYFASGMLDSENTFACYLSPLSVDANKALPGLYANMDRVVEKVKQASFVVAFGKSRGMVPYVRPEEFYPCDSILIDRKKMNVFLKIADEQMAKVFKPRLEEGVWLTGKVLDDGSYPVVITRQLKDEMGWKRGVGKKIYYDGAEYTVVGVISGIKQEPLKVSYPTMIISNFNCVLNKVDVEYTARIKKGEVDRFRDLLNREFYKMNGESCGVELSMTDLEKWKRSRMQGDYVALTVVLIPTLFLFVFAFIGTFGLYWLYASRRTKEFALRIVVGSTPGGLKRFVILEALLLTVLACLPGLVLFFWLYPVNRVNLFALLAACMVMVLFSVFSAWWPAYQVSRVNPVEAMREE